MASPSFRETFAYLPPPAECLAILIGFAEVTIFGISGLANPSEFAKLYGTPVKSIAAAQQHPGALAPASDEDEKNSTQISNTDKALVSAIAVRDIQHGVAILAFALYFKDRRATGVAVASGFITTLADVFIVQRYGLKEAVFGHVIGVANCALIGGSLLYWGRTDKLW